jgi:hypothetical protein
MEEPGKLIDWGVKIIREADDAQYTAAMKMVLDHYHPAIIVLRTQEKKLSIRAERVERLATELVARFPEARIKIRFLSRVDVQEVFDVTGDKPTRYLIACALADSFPEELGCRLPHKRQPWMGEDYRMAIFDAVALALTWLRRHSRRKAGSNENMAPVVL